MSTASATTSIAERIRQLVAWVSQLTEQNKELHRAQQEL